MIEELHDPLVKRLFLGFARTSDYNGPRKPDAPHHLIQEIDSELPVSHPALQLTHSIFGTCPPMRNFDPSKLLTVSDAFSFVHSLAHEISSFLSTFILNRSSNLHNFLIGLWKAPNT